MTSSIASRVPCLTESIFRIVALLYGLISFTLIGVRAVWEGHVTRRPSPEFWDAVDRNRKTLWDLSTCVTLPDTSASLHHHFEHLTTGVTLHYLCNEGVQDERLQPRRSSREADLVVFLHGFPDSCFIWTDIMADLTRNLNGGSNDFRSHQKEEEKEEHKRHAVLVAVDLPGYGGSDGLSNYGPEQVLGNLTLFVVAMRRKYLGGTSRGRVVLVAHDWGATIAYRLAATVPEIADHFVIINSALPQLTFNNLRKRWTTTLRLLKTWINQPMRGHLLRDAKNAIVPLLYQLICSSYIFIFNLPAPIAKLSGTRCNLWSLRFINDMTQDGKRHGKNSVLNTPARRLAATLGPNFAVCETLNGSGAGYSRSVTQRASDGAFPEAMRLYREGLAVIPWVPSCELRAALADQTKSGSGNRSDHSKRCRDGALKAPATVLWGGKDRALDHRIMVEGIEDYLYQGSAVVMLPDVGHWVPAESVGAWAVSLVVQMAVQGDLARLEDRLRGALDEGTWVVIVSKP